MNSGRPKSAKSAIMVALVILFASSPLLSITTSSFMIASILSQRAPDGWSRVWGGPGYHEPNSMAVSSNGDIYIAGGTTTTEVNYTAFLAKFDSNGEHVWNRTWRGIAFGSASAVAVSANGEIYAAGSVVSLGSTHSDIFLVKYDSSGNQLWNRTWGGADHSEGFSVAVSMDGGVYVAGYTRILDPGSTDGVLIKYTSNGSVLWYRAWGGLGTSPLSYSVATAGDSDVYVAGYKTLVRPDGFGEIDAFVAKYNSTGAELWSKGWGGSQLDHASSLVVTAGAVYVGGNTVSYGVGGQDAFIVKYNTSGDLLWNKTWGASGYEDCYSLAVSGNEDIYIVGMTTSSYYTGLQIPKAFVAKFDFTGANLWSGIRNSGSHDQGKCITIFNGSDAFFAGDTWVPGESRVEVFLVKNFENVVEPLPYGGLYSSLILVVVLVAAISIGLVVGVFAVHKRREARSKKATAEVRKKFSEWEERSR